MPSFHTDSRTLHYRQAAADWNQALPLGNGRLGAMVYGGSLKERLSLNDDTIWSGFPHDTINYGARQHLEEVRSLIFAGKYRQAQDIVESSMIGQGSEVYQVLGDLCIRRIPRPGGFPGWNPPPVVDPSTPLWNGVGDEPSREGDQDALATDYRRGLSLDQAICWSEFISQDCLHRRECLVSATDQVLVYRHAIDGGRASFRIDLACPLPSRLWVEHDGAFRLVLEGQCLDSIGQIWAHRDHLGQLPWDEARKGLRFVAALEIRSDGHVHQGADSKSLEVHDASWFQVYLGAASTFNGATRMPGSDLEGPLARVRGQIGTAIRLGWDRLVQRHLAEHRSHFDTMELELSALAWKAPAGAPLGQVFSDLPTDSRLEKVKAGDHDPGLAALMFNYGRYLLIASSRPGTRAANLQGIWNPHITPPWGSEYTTNINTEMNYWPAQACNLADCAEPLFDLVSTLEQSGTKTAVEHYGARGWCAHHNCDIWGNAAPVDGDASWAFWPMAGVWLVRHLWEHWLYSRDKDFLENFAWPVMAKAADFMLDWLVPGPDGKLATCPSTSPENKFLTAAGESASTCHSSTMDISLARDLLEACLEAVELCSSRQDLGQPIARALKQLPATRIAPDGRIAEWNEDFAEAEPGHRHVSHLYGLYPAAEFSGREDLEAAARASLEFRLKNGGGHTGWSCAWLINLWARLKDSQQAGHYVHTLLARSAYPNLLDSHPPFQIDGNFGYSSGVCEMLVQSHRLDRQGRHQVEIFPALPEWWPEGRVRGLRVRGGWELDFAWTNSQLVHLEARWVLGPGADPGAGCVCHWPKADSSFGRRTLKPGESRILVR